MPRRAPWPAWAVLLTACIAEDDAARDPPDDAGDAPAAFDGATPADGAPDAFRPDAAPPDAAPLDAGGAPDAAPDPCLDVCDRFAGCAIGACPAVDPNDRAGVEIRCAAACAEDPSFAVAAGETPSCEDLVAFGRQAVPRFEEDCPAGEGPVRRHPVCDVFGERVASCLVERCAPMDPLSETFGAVFADYCNGAIARGDADPAQLGRAFDPQTPCTQPLLRQIVDAQLVRDPARPQDGALADFCADGPYSPAETCRTACEAVAPCIPEDSEQAQFRAPDRCELLCVAYPDPPAAAWQCVAELEDLACPAVLQCFSPPPAPDEPACAGYAQRLGACAVEACPPLADVQAGFTESARLYCNDTVAREPQTRAIAESIGPETPCDEGLLQGIVRSLTSDDPAVAEDGQLVGLCAGGPANDAATCAAACGRLARCLPERGEAALLRDADVCAYFCALGLAASPVRWGCVAAAAECPAVSACLQAR